MGTGEVITSMSLVKDLLTRMEEDKVNNLKVVNLDDLEKTLLSTKSR